MKLNVSKSITINASHEKVYDLVADFNHWQSWSPWLVLEPGCENKIGGEVKSIGSYSTWDGSIIGSGKNTLASISENQLEYDLKFYKPWKSQAKVKFIFVEQGDKTKITWEMDSNMPFFMFFMIKIMKNWVGMDYDRGLRMLKAVAEHGKVKATTADQGFSDYSGFTYVGIRRTMPYADMPAQMQSDFGKIVQDVVIDNQKGAQHWVCIYPKFDKKTMMVTYIAAISDEDVKDIDLGAEYCKGTIKDTKVLEIKHDGAYDFLGNAWSMGMMTLRANKMKGGDYPFEQYWNSPMEEKPEDLKTSVYFPLK